MDSNSFDWWKYVNVKCVILFTCSVRCWPTAIYQTHQSVRLLLLFVLVVKQRKKRLEQTCLASVCWENVFNVIVSNNDSVCSLWSCSLNTANPNPPGIGSDPSSAVTPSIRKNKRNGKDFCPLGSYHCWKLSCVTKTLVEWFEFFRVYQPLFPCFILF